MIRVCRSDPRISRLVTWAKFKIRQLTALIWSFEDFEDSYTAIISQGCRPVIFVGRLLGALPRTDILSSEDDQRKVTPALVYSIILTLFYLLNAIMQLIANVRRYNESQTVYEKLHELILPEYAFILFFIQAYFLLNTGKLRNLLRKMLTIQPTNVDQNHGSPNYPRFCLVTLLGIMIYGISENVVYDVQNLGNADRFKTNSTIQRYYHQSLFHWMPYIPNDSCLTVIFIALIKCGTYSWIFGDILVIVLCRAVTERVKLLHRQIKQSLDSAQPIITNSSGLPETDIKQSNFSWDEVRVQYMTLKELTKEMSRFISPLMLSCYSINMYLIIINLFFWIAPNASFTEEQTFYSYFAFAHFSFRVSSVTYFVAEVYHMERLERSMIWNPCGITLFGTLIITRKFFISILSFIFTTEIVLLQTTK